MGSGKMGRSTLLTVITVTCLAVKVKAENTYITDNGRTCVLCPPGHFYIDDCRVPDTIALCKPCPQGTFSSNFNRAKHCAACMPHCESDILVTVQMCNATTNMVCDCPPGEILANPHDKYHANCTPFQGCEPGSGVLVQGTSLQEPKCAKCRPGITFSPELSSSEPCYPCTQCPNDDFVQECNTTHDRICNVPQPWYDKVAIPSLILNGSFIIIAMIKIMMMVMKLVSKNGGCPRKANREKSANQEECIPMNTGSNVSSSP
ncbi:tumor necrosis factor receptor superfamily member 11B-like [Pecten maximus]|uniref:tumor necrosis factor receptor superfamily member 11B-like n=1 Tax=Pecten maximus TaxID=6579 RepID=UPI0014584925|nr:tumor necrosis factor receptor superfamily member 11B-like [Pecten maximus]